MNTQETISPSEEVQFVEQVSKIDTDSKRRKMNGDTLHLADVSTMTSNNGNAQTKNTPQADVPPSNHYNKLKSIQPLLCQPTKFGNETSSLPMGQFQPGESNFEKLKRARMLVIGAGGLGCEILKDLALSGFEDIHVIDLDIIDLTNLNRQFLFRMKDVGKPKADVAAAFIMKRIPGVSVTPYQKKIQDMGASWYKQFDLIVAGLDNIEARRWINAVLCSFVDTNEDGDIETLEGMHNRLLNPQIPVEYDEHGNEIIQNKFIPLIDGGTEGFRGQARVIFPCFTPCFECTLEMFPPQETFAMCTIAETPRRPEHCVAYVMLIEWNKAFPGKKLDKDNPEDMNWIYERAHERAELFGIMGVTYMLTMGVVKNIIPAVASTNALISAACAHEAFKLATFSSHSLNNYFMFMGGTGVFTSTTQLERKPAGECMACRQPKKRILVSKQKLLCDIVDNLKQDPTLQLKNPSIMRYGKALWTPSPPSARAQTEANLNKPIGELVEEGEAFVVTDQMFPAGVSLTITFSLQ